MMLHTILFIRDHRTQIHILHTLEDVSFHKWIRLRKLMDQFLYLQTFGIALSILITRRTGICKFARTLDKMQMVRIAPCLNIVLAHEI